MSAISGSSFHLLLNRVTVPSIKSFTHLRMLELIVGIGVSILKSAVEVFCTPDDSSGLEPVRSSHFYTTFVSPNGPIVADADYHLRKISGLGQTVRPGDWAANNYRIPFPDSLDAAQITLDYILLSKQSGLNMVLSFWQDWFKLVYDFDNDMPALFNVCSGSGTVSISDVGGQPAVDYELFGVWPSGVVVTGFDRDSTTPAAFTVTLSVAQVRFK